MFTRNILVVSCGLLVLGGLSARGDEIEIFGYDLDGKEAKDADPPFKIVVTGYTAPKNLNDLAIASSTGRLEFVLRDDRRLDATTIDSNGKIPFKNGELDGNLVKPIVLFFKREGDSQSTAFVRIAVDNGKRTHKIHIVVPKFEETDPYPPCPGNAQPRCGTYWPAQCACSNFTRCYCPSTCYTYGR